jgi:DNA repair protein RecN (Recombination protein N)
LLDRDRKCVIEGIFSIENIGGIRSFLEQNDLDADDEMILRREISAAGKSRAFVNDTPVNLEQLRLLGSLLVDLHRQFDTLELGESDFQRAVIDAFAGHQELINQYGSAFFEMNRLKKDLQALQETKSQFTRDFDYNKFLFDELEKENLRENELEDLDAELHLLNSAEEIKSALTKTNYALNESEQPIVGQLRTLLAALNPFASLHPELAALLERWQSLQIELQDIADEIELVNDKINFDSERIEQISERISAGYKLLKKHSVRTTNDLISIREVLSGKLQSVLNIDDKLIAKENELERLSERAGKMALAISTGRRAQLKRIEEKVNLLLIQVGMPSARLKVTMQPVPMNAHGIDDIQFLFDGNKSDKFEALRKVASGGELSRLMLCIKSLVAESIDLPTMIFDEIDTGISGEAARQVGIILKGLSKKRQIVCITHQPQIAGKADAHYFVYKEIKDAAIKTSIRLLTRDERIMAIAKILSGERPTPAAIENAREMVN